MTISSKIYLTENMLNQSEEGRPNFLCFFSFFANLHFVQNLLRLSIQTSMQNLESVAQKMAELLHQVRKRTLIQYTRIAQPQSGLSNSSCSAGVCFASLRNASLRAHCSKKECKGINTNVPLASLRSDYLNKECQS